MGRFFAAFAAAASVVLAAAVLVSQTTTPREIVYTSTLEAPSTSTPEDITPPVSPLDIRAAIGHAGNAVAAAHFHAVESVPRVPWGEFGLAHVEIDREEIRFDSGRDAYVYDLPDGETAILTLDRGLQERLATTLDSQPEPGEAVVALEPATGRVLALLDDSEGGAFGPGLALRAEALAASTFKVITGAALMAEEAATPSTEVCFHGGGQGFDLDGLVPNAELDTQCMSLTTAMAWSANLVFARLADRHLSADTLQMYADRFGFNSRIPFEVRVGRSPARIPQDRLGFTRSAAGFYNTWMSPLHGAMIQGALANDGVMMVPTLVARIEAADGTVVYQHEPTVWREPVTAEVATRVNELMSQTCRSGTARADFGNRSGWPSRITAWGKTGTLSNRGPDATEEPDPYYIYRWFTGHAESGEDDVAVAGLVINTPQWHIRGTYLASEAVLGALR